MFGRRLRESEVVASMGSVGDCFDNAMAEAFLATLETELIDRNTFRNRTEARGLRVHRSLLQPDPPPLFESPKVQDY